MDRWSAIFAIIAHDVSNVKRIWFVRFMFVFVLLVAPLAGVAGAIRAGSAISIATGISPELGALMIRAILGFMTVVIGLYGLSTAGGATARRIALQRRQDTWMLFRLAPIGGLELATAQLLASLVPLCFCVAVYIPVIAFATQIISYRDGIELIATLALVIACCITAGAVNVLAAAMFQQERSTTFFTGTIFGLWCFGIQLIAHAVFESSGWLANTYPRAKLINRIDNILVDLSPARQVIAAWNGTIDIQRFLMCNVGLACLCIVAMAGAAWFFSREKPYTTKARTARPVSARLSDRIRLNLTMRHNPIRDGANPFYVLEMRRSYMGHPIVAAVYCGAPILIFFSVAYMFAEFAGPDDMFVTGWLIVACGAPILLGSTLTAPMIARERDENTFEMLAMTVSSPREILWGKMRAGIANVAPIVAIPFLSYFPFWLAGGRHYGMLAAFFATATVSLAAQLSAGLCASILAKNARDAASTSSSFSFTILLGGILITAAVGIIVFRLGTVLDSIAAPLSLTSPLFALGYFIGMKDDPMRFAYFPMTLLMFSVLAVALFFGAVELLRRQIAGMGRHANRGRLTID